MRSVSRARARVAVSKLCLGIFFTASGISAVVGPLLAGLIVDATGSYEWGIAFALAAGMLGFAAVALLRIPRDEGIIRPPCSP